MTTAYRIPGDCLLYREEGWPENLYKTTELKPEHSVFPVLEPLFKTKDGKFYPVKSGYVDPDFLSFGVWKTA